jgi:hypothetical protein
MRATCPSHSPWFDHTNLIKQCKLWSSSLSSFLHSPITSSLSQVPTFSSALCTQSPSDSPRLPRRSSSHNSLLPATFSSRNVQSVFHIAATYFFSHRSISQRNCNRLTRAHIRGYFYRADIQPTAYPLSTTVGCWSRLSANSKIQTKKLLEQSH